jgi:hypothetical protein
VGAWRVRSACAAYSCAGPPVQAYFIADGSLAATRIRAGFQVQASNRAGAVWLVSYPRSTDHIATTPARVQLVSTTGQPLGPRYRLPAGYLLSRGVGNYLLLNSVRTRHPYVSELWDPRTGQVVRRVDNVIAAGPDQIARSPGCQGCQAQVLNVSTGESMTIPIHGGQLSGLAKVRQDQVAGQCVSSPREPSSHGDLRKRSLVYASTPGVRRERV